MSSNLQMKILAKETAIYGVSSIVGKFLNWMLVPLYTYVLQQQSDYGIVTNLYAWTALLLVILTYGMETGFFRFANKEGENAQTVYSTSLIALFTTSLLFAVACVVCQVPIANALGYPAHSEFIALLGIVVAMDAFASIPFAYLRYKKRPLQFAALKLLFVFLNIVLNLFFLQRYKTGGLSRRGIMRTTVWDMCLWRISWRLPSRRHFCFQQLLRGLGV